MKNKLLYILLLIGIALQTPLDADAQFYNFWQSKSKKETRKNNGVTRYEQSGDRAFILGKYDIAVQRYSLAAEQLYKNNHQQWARMELKLARVYTMLQDYENAAIRYAILLENSANTLEVYDVCNYINALLCLDRYREAEIVARHFAYSYPYNRDQRYLNLLSSVSDLMPLHYATTDNEFDVQLYEASSTDAEYWIGSWDESIFCAVSNSRLMDPRKIFFHRTIYTDITGASAQEKFRYIPREVQNGPATKNGDVWIVTGIDYKGPDKVRGIDVKEVFRTKLYYTIHDTKRQRWSSPKVLFNDYEDANIAHPSLLDDGYTLLFSSDMEGGFGGMDLYFTKWDSELGEWSMPVNLGPEVNTEGDEIFPNVANGILYFSSNGHEGYGGYDIYSVDFTGIDVITATLYHYPYPINTVFNDYGLYQHDQTAFFISDRRGLQYRDDIYTFRNARTSLSSLEPTGMSHEYLALNGKLNQVADLLGRKEQITPEDTKLSKAYDEGDVICTIYYDFDMWLLPSGAPEQLNEVLSNKSFKETTELLVLGYADEIGASGYNVRLSERRAQTVADFLIGNGFKGQVKWEGKGSTTPDINDYNNQLIQYGLSDIDVTAEIKEVMQEGLPLSTRIGLNRTARKVDIILKKK